MKSERAQDLFVITNIFNPVTFTLGFDLSFGIFNLANNFWKVNARALLLLTSISSDNAFPLVPTFLTVTLVCFKKSLTLLMTFNSESYSFDVSYGYSLWQNLIHGYQHFLTLKPWTIFFWKRLSEQWGNIIRHTP